jgi:hypothetical protein
MLQTLDPANPLRAGVRLDSMQRKYQLHVRLQQRLGQNRLKVALLSSQLLAVVRNHQKGQFRSRKPVSGHRHQDKGRENEEVLRRPGS